jgi:hypothetical protein
MVQKIHLNREKNVPILYNNITLIIYPLLRNLELKNKFQNEGFKKQNPSFKEI